jgi:hypothetical protein
VIGQWLQKAGVFGIGPEDSSLKIALDEIHVMLRTGAFEDRWMVAPSCDE